MSLIPDGFAKRVHDLYGHQGETWLRDLPLLLTRCEEKLSVRIEAAFQNLSWNLLFRAQAGDGTPVVLKLAVEKGELSREVGTLRYYRGRGAVRVIAADEEVGAVVLERMIPGIPVSTIEDDEVATGIFCDAFRRLHHKVEARQKSGGVEADPVTWPPGLLPLRDHFVAIDRVTSDYREKGLAVPFATDWLLRGRTYLSYLLHSTDEEALLHGDLHHENILYDEQQGWVVIDPKGIIGDPHFDVIQYLLNHENRGGDKQTVLRRRIRQISDGLGLDPRRIAMWGVARGVLEACWTLESGKGEWERGIRMSERFAAYIAESGELELPGWK